MNQNAMAFDLQVGETLNTHLGEAINNTAYSARDADGLTLLILNDHLKRLCDLQFAALSQANKESDNGN